MLTVTDDGFERERKRKDDNDHHDHSGRRPYKKRHNEIKFDPKVREESNDANEIRKQVEFYFSDSNLVQDKFLFGLVSGSKNLPVDIKQIHEFKRMRRFQPFSAIVAALKESKVLEVVNGDQVQRKTPLPEEIGTTFDPSNIKVIEEKAMPRTIYAKGFGEETKSTQYDIEDFFLPYGVNAVRLRRSSYDKWFKGSVFVEFESEELVKDFLALNPKPSWNGKELLIMSKKEYCDKKDDDIEAGRIQSNDKESYTRHGKGGYRGRGGYKGNHRRNRDGHYDRDRRRNDRERHRDDDDEDKDEGFDADNWKRRRDDFQKNGFKDKKPSHKSSTSDDKADEQQGKDATAGAKDDDANQDKITSPSKKRTRHEDDGEVDEQDVKKSKTEEIDRDEEIRKAMPEVGTFHYRAVGPWVKTLEPYCKYF
jgi:lupus La protein